MHGSRQVYTASSYIKIATTGASNVWLPMRTSQFNRRLQAHETPPTQCFGFGRIEGEFHPQIRNYVQSVANQYAEMAVLKAKAMLDEETRQKRN